MSTFGLIGYPLAHSFSRNYFTEKFKKENISDAEFKNFPMEDINDFAALIKNNPTICGLSVTIPHKQSVMNFLDEIDEAAKTIGAVNCINISHQSSVIRLKGYNTDTFGFEQSLKPLLKPHHNKALVLGTGGASKAVTYILDKSKIKFRLVSRTKNDFLYSGINQSILQEYSLIINTTPLGTFPNVNDCPDIPYEFLSEKHLLYDLTYNPEESLFLKKGKEKGAQIKNGLEMLHLQAEKAWEIWNSNP
ncbi:MAG: shikimate dehydrogenase family protein [Bacteroidia bacterium]